MAAREREMRFTDRMSDHEALMWSIEKDPWLNPNGASLTILDRPLDLDHFRATMRNAVVKMPRLYERVVPGLARLSPPAWAPDPEFDVDFHVRHLELPAPGTERQLFDLAAQLYLEPLDRTRPLWRFVVIDGVEGGRSALWAIMHHAISDGIGQLRMAELYQQTDPNDPPPPEVDLDAVVANAVANHSAKEQGGDLASGFGNTATKTLSHLVRRQLGVARRAAGEVMIWPADPRRAGDKLGEARRIATSTVGALVGFRQRRARRIAAVEAALAAPPPRVGVGAARRPEGGRPASRCLDQRSVPGRADRGCRPVPRRPRRRGRCLQHELRAQHPHRPGDRRELVHADSGAGRRAHRCRSPSGSTTFVSAWRRAGTRCRPGEA